MNIDIDTIYGVQLGLEFADKETREFYPDMLWGFTVDLLIFRIVVTKYKEEE